VATSARSRAMSTARLAYAKLIGRSALTRPGALRLSRHPRRLRRLRQSPAPPDCAFRHGGGILGQIEIHGGAQDRRQLAPSSAAASSNTAWVCELRAICSGSLARPASFASERHAGSSSSASGFPAASASSRSRTSGDSSRAERPSNRSAGPWSSPASSSPSSPGGSKRRRSPSRAANNITIPSASRRRAVNTSESADGTSSQCVSSIRHRIGRSSAAAASSDNTPAEIRNRSEPAAGVKPRAAATASRWGAGTRGRWSTIGRTRLWSPAKPRSDSASTPVTQSTLIPTARSAA
jgi:hypothetical protein